MAKSAQDWLDILRQADRREKDFRTDGKRLYQMYNGEESPPTAFNILYSNTETLLPALFSATPVPLIHRRKSAKPVPLAREAALLGQKILAYEIDSGDTEQQSFYEAVETAVLDALLCGRGVAYACHEYTELDGTVAEASIHPRHCQWDGFRHGYAKRWQDVPWVSFQEVLPIETAKEKWPKATFVPGEVEEKENVTRDEREAASKIVTIHKIWDRATRTVVTVSPNAKDDILEMVENPLDVEGFFPCPRPLYIVRKSNSLTPTAPFKLYENQAKELNRLTERINKIVETLKVRGIYNAAIQELQQVFQAEDGVLIPAKNVEQLAAQNADIDRAIWLMPVERIVMVLRELYQARESCKAVIFEICGIADIMRGASKASETLGAQQIKNQWGTLRLKKLQAEVQRFVRDLLRIMLDASLHVLPPEVVSSIAGQEFPPLAQRDAARQQVQLTAMTGQAPSPELMVLAGSSALEEVLSLLQNDAQRDFLVTVETNSTLSAEASEEQQQVTMAFTGVSQVINGLAPLIEKGVMPFEVAQTFLLAIARKFPFGSDVEAALEKLQAPKPPEDGAAKAAMAQKDLQIQGLQGQLNVKAQEAALQKREFDVTLREKTAEFTEQLLKTHEKVSLEGLRGKELALKTRETPQAPQKSLQGVQDLLGALQQQQAQLGEAVVQAGQQTQALMTSVAAGMQQLAEALAVLQEAVTAPKDIIRDPKTNRIVQLVPRSRQNAAQS